MFINPSAILFIKIGIVEGTIKMKD
uniref:Uncharacterized protein n=1 Tax=Tetranychus urticae TaxID=32264 RepID=T1JPX3_TETUR